MGWIEASGLPTLVHGSGTCPGGVSGPALGVSAMYQCGGEYSSLFLFCQYSIFDRTPVDLIGVARWVGFYDGAGHRHVVEPKFCRHITHGLADAVGATGGARFEQGVGERRGSDGVSETVEPDMPRSRLLEFRQCAT